MWRDSRLAFPVPGPTYLTVDWRVETVDELMNRRGCGWVELPSAARLPTSCPAGPFQQSVREGLPLPLLSFSLALVLVLVPVLFPSGSSWSLSKVIAEKLLVTFHDLKWPRRHDERSQIAIFRFRLSSQPITLCLRVFRMAFVQKRRLSFSPIGL